MATGGDLRAYSKIFKTGLEIEHYSRQVPKTKPAEGALEPL